MIEEEPYHYVLLAYAQLLEHERLMSAVELDARYHVAKLGAYGFHDPKLIDEERITVRSALLRNAPQTGPAPLSRDDHMALALDIARKLEAAGVLHTGVRY